MKKIAILISLLLILTTGSISLAADSPHDQMLGAQNQASGSCASVTDFKSFVGCVTGGLIKPLIYLIFAVALVYFLFGVLKYIRRGSDEDDRRAGRDMMIYGIIALAVMFSVWGLVNMVIKTFNLSTTTPTVTQF